MKKQKKIRADEHLVNLGLVPSRTQAQACILGGKVRMPDNSRVDKPGRLLCASTQLSLDTPYPYVGRGGEKLAHFLDVFDIKVENLRSLDIGASTGGFTDCLLQRGIASATCVDVGHGQLHHKLRIDGRVKNLEKTNARYIEPNQLPYPHYPIIVIDVSFISLKKILPHIWSFLSPKGYLIALIKPQFEAEKKDVDKGKGVIKDPILQNNLRDSIIDFSIHTLEASQLIGCIPSPISGADGNKEFLLGLIKNTS